MSENLLSSINYPDLQLEEDQLRNWLRIARFHYRHSLRKEGHLGASLGVVDHYCRIALFNTPDDLLIWDVGHKLTVTRY
jgi:deoxyxylulose-5-phosphate synthase